MWCVVILSKQRKHRVKVTESMKQQFLLYLLEHMTIPDISKKLNICVRTGYRIKDELLKDGSIQQFGYKYPGFYIAGERTKSQCIEGGALVKDPEVVQLTEAHLSGSFYVAVLQEGRRDAIRDSRGFTYGYWSKEVTHPTGSSEYKADIRVFETPATFYYRRGNQGSKTIRIDVNRITLDPQLYDTPEQIIGEFVKRAMRIFKILEAHNWIFSDNFTLKGEIHFAWPDHPWGEFLDRVYNRDDGGLIVDHSNGRMETELTGVKTPEGLRAGAIITHVAAHIAALHEDVNSANLSIFDMQKMSEEQRKLLGCILENQNLISEIFFRQQESVLGQIKQETYQTSDRRMEGYQ